MLPKLSSGVLTSFKELLKISEITLDKHPSIGYNVNMKKEISYYEQALALPNLRQFQTYLLEAIASMGASDDALEAISLRYMETEIK